MSIWSDDLLFKDDVIEEAKTEASLSYNPIVEAFFAEEENAESLLSHDLLFIADWVQEEKTEAFLAEEGKTESIFSGDLLLKGGVIEEKKIDGSLRYYHLVVPCLAEEQKTESILSDDLLFKAVVIEEAKIEASLSHDHLVEAYFYGGTENRIYIKLQSPFKSRCKRGEENRSQLNVRLPSRFLCGGETESRVYIERRSPF